ncbi:MAG: response regulator [Jatrophihabitans sp.]|nr:MAG: response regulator [Jatrophihabitans sp.]
MTQHLERARRAIRVLLVEDDPGDVLIAREALKAAGLSMPLEVVSDGDEALEFLRATGRHATAVRPDLVLLDLNLPGRSGLEVLAEVKADPDLRRIPVVVLTTSGSADDITRSYDLHANVFVAKPVDFDDFARVVQQIDQFFGRVAELPPR